VSALLVSATAAAATRTCRVCSDKADIVCNHITVSAVRRPAHSVCVAALIIDISIQEYRLSDKLTATL